MSPMLIERLAATLGDLLVDPHGDPIPQDRTIAHPGLTSLYDTPPGHTVAVRRVRDQSSELLRYLSKIGLVPGTLVEVLIHLPLNGPLTVRVDDSEQVSRRDLANIVLVAPFQGN